jgi:DNA-binding CsgD family transcriptional regulator
MQSTQTFVQSVPVSIQPDIVRKGPTPREIEALKHISNGNDSKTTAKLMKISKRTVDFHLANVYMKLGAGNRVQAINIAKAKGYL